MFLWGAHVCITMDGFWTKTTAWRLACTPAPSRRDTTCLPEGRTATTPAAANEPVLFSHVFRGIEFFGVAIKTNSKTASSLVDGASMHSRMTTIQERIGCQRAYNLPSNLLLHADQVPCQALVNSGDLCRSLFKSVF